MTALINHEDAARALDRFAGEIILLGKRLDRFAETLRPDWQDKFNAIPELQHINPDAADKLKALADDIYKQGEAEAEVKGVPA